MAKTPKRLHPLAPARGFGFDALMRRPDYSRFPTWYEATTRLDDKAKR